AAYRQRPAPLRVAVRLGLRPPLDGADRQRGAAARQRLADGPGAGRVRAAGRPGGAQAAGAAGGQRRLARREAPGRAGQRGAVPAAAVHPGAAAGGAVVAAAARGGGQPGAGRHAGAGGAGEAACRVAGRAPRGGPGRGAAPLWRSARTGPSASPGNSSTGFGIIRWGTVLPEGIMVYQETFVRRDGHRIYARQYPGAEPAIVLMHGFPDNLHLYDRLVPFLSPPRR